MRTLYLFGPNFGLPDPSPFCMKAMILLKMAGLDYDTAICDPRKAPKKKGPYLVDDGESIPDSTFIRWHIEEKYGHDFDAALSASDKGVAWAIEKLCEDNIYWSVLHQRWMVEKNFSAGPRTFFMSVPMPFRHTVIGMVRGQIKRDLWGQGFGRHSQDEIVRIGNRGLDALAQILGDKPYMLGEECSSADAIAFPTVAGVLTDTFDTDLRTHAEGLDSLVAYKQRCMKRWFPEFDEAAPSPETSVSPIAATVQNGEAERTGDSAQA